MTDAMIDAMTDAMTDAGAWADANQRDLVRALERVRVSLARHTGDQPAAGDAAESATRRAEAPPNTTPNGEFALGILQRRFGLSAFETDILVMCAGIEMDARFAPLIVTALGDPARGTPTFGLALAALPGAHWSALTPGAPLRAWRLVEMEGAGVTTAGLRLDERIVHFLAGINEIDDRLRGVVAPVEVRETTRQAFGAVASRIVSHLDRGEDAHAAQVTGADAETRFSIAASACATMGASALTLRATDIPAGAAERFALGRLVAREALLRQGVVIIDARGEVDGTRISDFIDVCPALALVCADEPVRAIAGKAAAFGVATPTHEERTALWLDALGSSPTPPNGAATVVSRVSAHFDLSLPAMREAAARVRVTADDAPGRIDGDALWDAARLVARPRMEGLAQRIEAIASWDDLVLPEPQRRVLREITMHVQHRRLVYDDWGFAEKSARGLGITALFAGASGTGKTMAAEVLARDLRLDLYRIDLSSVVSKYIGETEKNLSRVFDEAERSGAVLLFDEADALFGKRSEVKDSHDRYANIEVSYLLQRMEAYSGLAILTTNMKEALDPAFLRRIRFMVHFPFPDTEQRTAIWRGIFPERTPTADLDYARLARLNVAGGNIRNIALGAAFLAATRGDQVVMRDVADAARSEYAKLERVPTDAEMRGWG